MRATLQRFCEHMASESSNHRRLEAGFAAGEFVRFFDLPARPKLEEIVTLLEEIGAGSVTAKYLPDGLRGVHIPRGDGGYEIHHLPDDWRGGIEQTLMHETYEIIYESLGNAYGNPGTVKRICREARRFAAAVLMQPETFEAFAVATGLDVVALRKQFGCSYASVALRLGEVMGDRPLLAVVYERREEARPLDMVSGARGDRFQGVGGGADAGVRGPGFAHAVRGEGRHAPSRERSVSRVDGRPGGPGRWRWLCGDGAPG